jgi:hypothetical protein
MLPRWIFIPLAWIWFVAACMMLAVILLQIIDKGHLIPGFLVGTVWFVVFPVGFLIIVDMTMRKWRSRWKRS